MSGLGKLLQRLTARRLAVPRNLSQLGKAAARDLTGNLLPFWLKYARDPQTGAFRAQLDRKLRPASKSRGALLASRILWTFSVANRRTPDPAYAAMARAAYDDLRENFLDHHDGGLFWSIKPGGLVHDEHKRIYGQAFGIYGLSEYARMTGERAPLELAIDIYRRVEAHACDRARGGYSSVLGREWQPTGEPADAAKSMNTMLHLMEAYTNLYRAWPDAGLRGDLQALVLAILDHAITKGGRICMLADPDWAPLSPNHSPGHEIEFNWLLTETCAALGDIELANRARDISLALARLVAGDVAADGALFYEAGPNGIVDGKRQWWVHAEAVVGFLNAFELSGDRAFADKALACWGYIERNFIDRKNGGWLSAQLADGSEDRAARRLDIWTCPYHNARADMEIAERVKRLV